MARIVAVANLKGGVGKTTLAVNLSCALAARHRVQLVDADAQASASDWLTAAVPGVAVTALPLEAETERGIAQWTARVRGIAADVVIIDAPPHLAATTGAAIGLCDLVLIPCGPSLADMRATVRTLELIAVARGVRRGKPAALIVPNRIDHRTTTGRGLAKALRELGEPVGPELVTRQAQADAIAAGMWIGAYAPASPATAEIGALAALVERQLFGRR